MDSCNYCKGLKEFKLYKQSDLSLYTGSSVSIEASTHDIHISTADWFKGTLLWMNVSSTDTYCSTYLGTQTLSLDFEVCGQETVIVEDPTVAIEYNVSYRIDPNF